MDVERIYTVLQSLYDGAFRLRQQTWASPAISTSIGCLPVPPAFPFPIEARPLLYCFLYLHFILFYVLTIVASML